MPWLINVNHANFPAAAVLGGLRFQMGNIRPVETDDATDNWSSLGSDQRGWTKHHLVPWNTLKNIMNRALLDLQENKDDKLWSGIKKAAYVGGNGGANQAPLGAAVKYLKGLVIPLPLPGAAALARENDGQPHMPAPHWNAINGLASHFCWMPGNFFLGPTPGSRLDDPGNDGFDTPPMGKGGTLGGKLKDLYDYAESQNWPEVNKCLDAIFSQGVAKKGKVINHLGTDWNMSLVGAANFFKKKLA
jgi:hypothetical protein